MCGIAGVIQNRGNDASVLVKGMLDRMKYRGPDEQGYWCFGQSCIGMNRLSIIDRDTHNPPYHNKEKSITVAYNGEIYNHKELRKGLDCEGYFPTESDVEIFVNLYDREGISCVDKLNGMFSIALCDRKLGKLYLIRDRAGEKPLYYFRDKDRLVFSSEIKALLDITQPNH